MNGYSAQPSAQSSNSADNLLCQKTAHGANVPIVRKWGHPWLLLKPEESVSYANLTDGELRQLHRRFGHLSIDRLATLLNRAARTLTGLRSSDSRQYASSAS